MCWSSTHSHDSKAERRRRAQQRVGMSIIYVLFALPCIILLISLAVDIGRIRVAKGEVQTGADAAAMGAVMTLPKLDLGPNGSWNFADIDQTAIDLAAANPITVDGVSVQLVGNQDIEYGIWNPTTRTFTRLGFGGSAGNIGDARQRSNAVRVTSHRAEERGNPLPLTVARFFEQNSRDLLSTATAMIDERGNPSLGIIGLNSVGSNGTKATVDSYLPSLGLYENQPRRQNALVGSNGDIDLGNSDIYGSVRPGVGKRCIQGPTSFVTGWIQPLEEPLVFPPVTVPGGALPLPPAGGNVGPGTYTIANWPNKDYTFTGPVSIYVTGNMKIKGNTVINSFNKLPANLKLYLTSSASMDMNGGGTLYAHVYCPGAPVNMVGSSNRFYGSMIAKSISYKGTVDIHYDESAVGDPDHHFSVVLVK